MRKIDRIIVHCSGTEIDHDLEDIRRWHLVRGFDDIGYHFVIDKKGNLHFGRDVQEVGAHVRGHNTGSIGICMLGDVEMTEDQLQETAKLCRLLMAVFEIDVEDVRGHYEFTDLKTCPNIDMQVFREQYIGV